MKRTIKAAAASVLAIALAPQAHAQNIFLSAENIKGDSTVRGFEDQVELNSFDFGLGTEGQVSSSRRTLRGCRYDALEVTKDVDSATADFILAAALQTVIPEMEITATRSSEFGAQEVFQLQLRNVRVANFDTMADEGGIAERLMLAVESVEGTVFVQNDRAGGVTEEPFDVPCF